MDVQTENIWAVAGHDGRWRWLEDALGRKTNVLFSDHQLAEQAVLPCGTKLTQVSWEEAERVVGDSPGWLRFCVDPYPGDKFVSRTREECLVILRTAKNKNS